MLKRILQGAVLWIGAVALTGCPRSGYGTLSDAGRPAPMCELGEGYAGGVPFAGDDFATLDASTLPHAAAPCMAPVFGRVTRISDGDTIHVQYEGTTDAGTGTIEEQVRLIGVNSPEIAHPPEFEQCFGDEAQRFSQQLVGHDVWLTFDRDCRDPFQRLLAYVHTSAGPGGFYNRQLMRRGFARVLTVAPNTAFQSTFAQDQADAACARQGLHLSCSAADAGSDH